MKPIRVLLEKDGKPYGRPASCPVGFAPPDIGEMWDNKHVVVSGRHGTGDDTWDEVILTIRESQSKIIVDGIEIDSSIWIDAHIARFKDRNSVWAIRRRSLLEEIANYEVVLKNFGTVVPSDAFGEAHTKAYLAALRRTQQELTDEISGTMTDV